MKNLKKYTLRLRHASFSEICYRIKLAVENRRIKAQLGQDGFTLNIPQKLQANFEELSLPSFQTGGVGLDSVDYSVGNINSLNASKEEISNFEKRLAQTFSGTVGGNNKGPDIRAVWEPARLQHITTLLYQLDNTENRLEIESKAKKELLHWIEKNPFLLGPHYHSVMECGLRIPVFFYGLKKLVSLTKDEQFKIVTAIYQHAWWISRRLSLFSSLGNHTVCEAVGLIFAGAIFKKVSIGEKWLSKGISLLKQELEHQVLEDGGPAEQSLNYHRFVLDLYWLAIDFLEKNTLADCSNLIPRLILGEKFLNAFMYSEVSFASIGDSDDGFAIAPCIMPVRGQWAKREDKAESRVDRITSFMKSGYSILRQKDGMHMTFDHGPLGMAPLYNHGHADALAITLSSNSVPFLVDPGTYRYNGAPEWRHYFKSTRAHNTVTINEQDLAVQETGFIWSRPYQASLEICKKIEGGVFLQASHDGYTRFKHPVTHSRTILWLNEGNILIKDTFAGQGPHFFELNFHFHPGVVIMAQESGWIADHEGVKLYIDCNHKLTHVKGQEQPLLGWYSSAYGKKEPCSVLQGGRIEKPGKMFFLTVISSEKRKESTTLEDRLNEIEQEVAHS